MTYGRARHISGFRPTRCALRPWFHPISIYMSQRIQFWLRSWRANMRRREFITLLERVRIPLLALSYVLAFATLMQNPALAQDWPQRPLHIIVAFGPGGTTDVVARIIGQGLQERLRQSVVIENRAGAGGTLGFDVVARAEKDGYTLGLMTAGQIIAAAMRRSLPYDTLTAFEPISLVAETSLVIFTRPEFPASDVRELIALDKTNA